MLSKAGYITATQFEEAKAVQKKSGERLGRILLESGAIERDTIANFLSRMHNYTMVVIEHNLDVIKTADWVIDMGPEGGNAGGQLLASGTPEQIAKEKNSHTGRFLKKELP